MLLIGEAVRTARPGRLVSLALANLHRPGSPTPIVMLSLGLGLTVLVATALIEGNLREQITQRIPKDAPAFFFVDIQSSQIADFEKAIAAVPGAGKLEEVPSLRGRIVKIGGEAVNQLKVPPDALIVEGIAGILRYFPFEQTRPLSAHLLTNEPRLYSVGIEIRGKEHVKTPAGEFDCYKVEMIPHLGLLNIVRSFFPRTFFWFTVAPPHFWVRYEGLENGPGTPEIVMELDRN